MAFSNVNRLNPTISGRLEDKEQLNTKKGQSLLSGRDNSAGSLFIGLYSSLLQALAFQCSKSWFIKTLPHSKLLRTLYLEFMWSHILLPNPVNSL